MQQIRSIGCRGFWVVFSGRVVVARNTPKSTAARVLVVDDHSIVRIGLTQLLEQSGEFEAVDQAAVHSKTVLSIVKCGGPELTVDSTMFESVIPL